MDGAPAVPLPAGEQAWRTVLWQDKSSPAGRFSMTFTHGDFIHEQSLAVLCAAPVGRTMADIPADDAQAL